MRQAQFQLNQHYKMMNIKPNFAEKLARKFNQFLEEEPFEDEANESDPKQQQEEVNPHISSAGEMSEKEDDDFEAPKLVRGKRPHEAACLRIVKMERALA